MKISPRTLSITAGVSYVVIFFAAIFANFVALETLLNNPLATVEQNGILVRLGSMAFLVAAVADVVVAWALYELYKTYPLNTLSTYFRVIHAVVMAIAVFALIMALSVTTTDQILLLVDTFNTIWLIGLLFFGVHLILLAQIITKPKFIAVLLAVAGVMYIVDTSAHFLLQNYNDFASIFLTMVAIPSILGEMSFAIWLLVKGGKR